MYKVEYNANFKLYFFKSGGNLLLKGLFGKIKCRVPASFYLKSNEAENYSCKFLVKKYYKNFMSGLRQSYVWLFILYFYKMRLWGLGFRVRKMCLSLYRFYFIWPNYIYLHVPKMVWIRCRLQRILLVCNNLEYIRMIAAELLLLKEIIPYRRKGIHFGRRLILMKKGKKKF